MTHSAAGDCERVRDGWIGQPVNTATSFAYLLAAPIVLASRGPRRREWAAALTAVGLGSVAYHGPGTRLGRFLHDVSLAHLGAVVARGGRRSNARRRPAAAIGLVAALIHGTTRTGRCACRPDSPLQGHGLWHVVSAAALVLYATGEA